MAKMDPKPKLASKESKPIPKNILQRTGGGNSQPSLKKGCCGRVK